MKYIIKNIIKITSLVGVFFLNTLHSYAGMSFTDTANHPINANLQGSSTGIDVVIQNWAVYLAGFLYFIALAVMIYAGVVIITGLGNEERVKKGKDILLYAVIGLIVVFTANSIIQFVIKFTKAGTCPAGQVWIEANGACGTP